MDESTTGAGPTSTLSPGPDSFSRKEFRSSFQADLLKHTRVHESDALWTRFITPFSPNHSGSPSADGELINKIVQKLRTTCLTQLDTIQSIQDAPSDNEKLMMDPLDTLFQTIEKETAEHRKKREHFRVFIRKDSTLVPLVNPPFGNLSIVKPDFVLAELPSPRSGLVVNLSDRKQHVDWRQCPAFIEIKAKSAYLPGLTGEAGKNTLTQAGDYARLLMAGRPFLISTYAFFICGNKFCIALCDRSGIVVSPPKRLSSAQDAVKDLAFFTSVVLRFIWDMSLVELGEDPTTSLAENQTRYQERYPHHDVSMGANHTGAGFEKTHWTTVGEPLWVSHSLVGRGTSVWRALDQEHTPLILKVSWRTDGRRSETEIHRILRSFLRNSGIEEPKGLALASSGGDVFDNSGEIMSVSKRRGPPEEEFKPTINRILHRVCLTRFGKPIWEYSSLQEFAQAMRDAINAHDVLSGYGILHRDISAGNILIDQDASYKEATATGEPGGITSKDRPAQNASGFLSDWEFAWFPQGVLEMATHHAESDPQPVEDDMSMKVTPGDVMTGTVIFFATEVLLGLRNKRQVIRNRAHDLESFEWVILYTIYTKSLKTAHNGPQEMKKKEGRLMKEFQNIFAAVDPSALADKRVLLLLLPTSEDDWFGNIRQLLSFVEAHVKEFNSKTLPDTLMDIWEDLMYRYKVLATRPPVRPGRRLQADYQPPLAASIKHLLSHADLIEYLESLIPPPS